MKINAKKDGEVVESSEREMIALTLDMYLHIIINTTLIHFLIRIASGIET